jgi:fumarate reductase (CoM/CoB) subunit B
MMHPEDRGDRVGTAFREGVFNCTMCGKCEKVCLKDQPPPIPIPEMVMERLRQDAVEGGMTPLPYKEFTKLVQETGRIIPLKDKPLLERLPEIVDVKNPVKEVALFTGCLIDYNLQNSGLALTKILNKNKVRIHIPKEQQCCGSPFFRNGQPGIGRNLVKINTKIFEALKVETVVTACAECGATLKKDYPKILGRDPEFKVMDITEFLANEIDLDTEKMKELKMTVTFSDPCYLKTWQGISKEPREILKKIPGLKLVEMENSDACCGAGGGLRLGNPDLSMEIAKTKIPMILESSAQAVVTSCPWCQLNLIDGLEDKGPEVLNLVELLERTYSK